MSETRDTGEWSKQPGGPRQEASPKQRGWRRIFSFLTPRQSRRQQMSTARRSEFASVRRRVETLGIQLWAIIGCGVSAENPRLKVHAEAIRAARERYWKDVERYGSRHGWTVDDRLKALLKRIAARAAREARRDPDPVERSCIMPRHFEKAVEEETPEAEPPVAVAESLSAVPLPLLEKANTIGDQMWAAIGCGIGSVDPNLVPEDGLFEYARGRYAANVISYAEDFDSLDAETQECMKQVGIDAATNAMNDPSYDPNKPNNPITQEHFQQAFDAAEVRTQAAMAAPGDTPAQGAVCS